MIMGNGCRSLAVNGGPDFQSRFARHERVARATRPGGPPRLPGSRKNTLPIGLVVWLAAMFLAANALAANPRHKYNRPAVSISPTSFTLSYGKTAKLCVTVTPARKASLFTNPAVWRNTVPGVFTITPGADENCTGTGKVSLTVLSRVNDICEPNGGVVAVLNKVAAGPAAPAAVLVPDRESATRISDTSAPGLIETQWQITFSNSGASANFNGLPVKEHTFISAGDLNTCEMVTGADDPRLDHEWTLANNSLVDANTRQETETRTCTSVLSQTFRVGSCTVPAIGTPIKLTFKFVGGTPSFARSDAGGQ